MSGIEDTQIVSAEVLERHFEGLISFYNDVGVDWLIEETPQDQIAAFTKLSAGAHTQNVSAPSVQAPNLQQLSAPQKLLGQNVPSEQTSARVDMATPEAVAKATELAQAAENLEDLKKAIEGFDGLDLKHMATQIVFSDGNSEAPLMIIGEAPGGDEDRAGRPFVGTTGQLLDKMLAAIGYSRAGEAAEKAAYISNVINWRPPGNRSPTPQEIEISLPFIEKHILLAKPKALFLLGGVSAKALSGETQGITKLRGKWFDWSPSIIKAVDGETVPIPALPSYHPAFLLRQPEQKRKSWQDLLALKAKLEENA